MQINNAEVEGEKRTWLLSLEIDFNIDYNMFFVQGNSDEIRRLSRVPVESRGYFSWPSVGIFRW